MEQCNQRANTAQKAGEAQTTNAVSYNPNSSKMLPCTKQRRTIEAGYTRQSTLHAYNILESEKETT